MAHSAFLLSVVLVGLRRLEQTTSSDAELQRAQADMCEIDQIEKDFHEAMSKKDIDLMMSLFAPNATFTVGPGETATGMDEIRQFWLEKSAAFEPGDPLGLRPPRVQAREVTVNGDRGTLHFECHFVDVDTGKLALTTVADLDVARIDGRWLITNLVGGTTELKI